jgi:DNA primase
MKIKDPFISYIEAHADIPHLVKSYFPEWEGRGLVMCPHHEDTKPSLSISEEGKAKCHGCGWYASNIVHFLQEMEGITEQEAKDWIYEDLFDVIPASEIDAYCRCLFERSWARDYLEFDRNIPEGIMKKFKLGLQPETERITIPVYDSFGYCVDVIRKKFKGRGAKSLHYKRGKGIRLYPEDKAFFERRLVLVEGEWDVLVGRSYGLPTVSWTGGALSWGDDFDHLFRDKAVWILYDNDDAGRGGTKQVEQRLEHLAYYTEVVPPLNPTQGKDLTDWSFTATGEIQKLLNRVRKFKFPRNGKKKKVCPYCGHEVKK